MLEGPNPEEVSGMKRMSIAIAATIAAILAVTVTAFGALPKKGGVYVGTIKSSPFEMFVNLGVTSTGTKARFTYLCGTGRPPTVVFGVPIDSRGYFKFTKMTGSIVVWKMAGHFLSPTKVFVSLNSLACGGSKGSTMLTLK
jgi:hypothetical protein